MTESARVGDRGPGAGTAIVVVAVFAFSAAGASVSNSLSTCELADMRFERSKSVLERAEAKEFG